MISVRTGTLPSWCWLRAGSQKIHPGKESQREIEKEGGREGKKGICLQPGCLGRSSEEVGPLSYAPADFEPPACHGPTKTLQALWKIHRAGNTFTPGVDVGKVSVPFCCLANAVAYKMLGSSGKEHLCQRTRPEQDGRS